MNDPARDVIGINLELTDRCPFRCPQCYVPVKEKKKELPLEEGLRRIRDAASCGIRYVNLSGGETLCYPYLNQLVAECRKEGMVVSIALSGFGADAGRLKELAEAGVLNFCVSLNGSTEEINSVTRMGYREAVRTLKLLKEMEGCFRTVNWVMHKSNAEDLPEMIRLCEELHVHALMILQRRPDSSGLLSDVPGEEEIRKAAELLNSYRGPVMIVPDGCFFELMDLLEDGNPYNAEGDYRGCSAGVTHVAVNAEGSFLPCRHLDLPEKFGSVREYLDSSRILKEIRKKREEDPDFRPCSEGCAKSGLSFW